MYKYILDSIQGVDWLAIGPLILFFTFFCWTTIQVIRKSKEEIQHMENLPLDD